MEYLLIALATFFASFISFYSGFGLGTILMPVIAIFLPLPLAITLTAIIHLFHNLLKTGLLWRAVDWNVAIRFGSMALIASIPGALLLKKLSVFTPLMTYSVLGIPAELSLLHICIGLLLILFATLEAFPYKDYRVKNLYLGGALSGFLGGLSGNQGALRSVFLINSNLKKEPFIATNAFIAVVVDSARLVIYSLSFQQLFVTTNRPLIMIPLAASLGGVLLGMLLLKKITIALIQRTIIVLLYVLGILLVAGII